MKKEEEEKRTKNLNKSYVFILLFSSCPNKP